MREILKLHSKWFYKAVAICFLFLLTLIFFYPVLFQGRTFYAFDILRAYYPWSSFSPGFVNNPLIGDPVNLSFPFSQFVKNWVNQGSFPLWIGLTFCGLPISAGGISLYSNPVVFFSYMLFPTLTAHDFVLWFHLLGIGLFMLLYLREMELDIYPALMGAVAWMFNGSAMVWFEWESIAILAFSLPATLYFVERWLKTRSIRHCLFFTLAVVYAVSSGFPHILIYQLLFVSSYTLYRYMFRGKESGGSGRTIQALLHLGLSIVLGLLGSALFLFSHLASLGDLQRPQIPFWELFQRTGQLPGKYLLTLLFPDFFGSPVLPMCFTPGRLPYNNYNELCIYAGIPTLFLAVACIPYIRRRNVGFFFLTAILALTMAMGSILYYPLAEFIPGLNLSTPTRIVYIFGFSISVLAGLGAQILAGIENRRKRWQVFTLWSLLFGIGVGASVFVQTEGGIEWAASLSGSMIRDRVYAIYKPHFDILSAVITGPLLLMTVSFYVLSAVLFLKTRRLKDRFILFGLVILAFDLMSFAFSYNTVVPKNLAYPVTDAIAFLKKDPSSFRIITYDRFLHNGFSPFGIEDVGGYAPFYPKRYGDYLHLTQHGPDGPLPDYHSRWVMFHTFGSPLLDLVNVKYVLVPKHVVVETAKLELVFEGEIKIYRNKAVFPRVFFVRDYEVYPEEKEVYRATGRFRAEDFRKKVIVEKPPPADFIRDVSEITEMSPQEIRIRAYTPNRIELEVSTASKGFLVIGDNYHPGWRAEVGGKETEILRANYIMRALPLKSGSHRITLTFTPKALIGGVLLTALGWTALLVLILFSFWKSKRRSELSEPYASRKKTLNARDS